MLVHSKYSLFVRISENITIIVYLPPSITSSSSSCDLYDSIAALNKNRRIVEFCVYMAELFTHIFVVDSFIHSQMNEREKILHKMKEVEGNSFGNRKKCMCIHTGSDAHFLKEEVSSNKKVLQNDVTLVVCSI